MRKLCLILSLGILTVLLAGCSLQSSERVKLKDLDFTVLSEEKIPQELKTLIEERKAEPFRLTYKDKEFLYLVTGYGEQKTGGYSIAVNELYLTEDAIYVSTSLLGPKPSEKGNTVPSYPYIVMKLELLEQTVIFE